MTSARLVRRRSPRVLPWALVLPAACGGGRTPPTTPVAAVSVPAPPPAQTEAPAPESASLVQAAPASSRPPRVRLGQFTLQGAGALPPEVIHRIVQQRLPKFRLCYEEGLKRRENLEGRVWVRFVIDSSGEVMRPVRAGNDMADVTMADCVSEIFTTIVFPSPDHDTVTIVFPIEFAP